MSNLKAEILSIGTEILLGNIVNTNAAYLSSELAALGVFVFHQTVVGDNPGRLQEALEEGFGRANVIISTGGLGPTTDDLSKETAAAFFGRKMVQDPIALENMERLMSHMGREITPNNYKQADLPEGAIPLYNAHGTAPGFILEDQERILIMMPGPPKEMKPMFDEQVRPYLASRCDSQLYSRTLHVCGLGESAIEYQLKKRMDELTNPTLAPYAKGGHTDLRITAKATDEKDADALINPIEMEIRRLFGDYVYGVDEDTLEGSIVELLAKKNWHLCCAESCTGGMLAARIVDYPGASRVLNESYVTYSNEAKERLLGVSHDTLSSYGAVSRQTAVEMAFGAAKASGSEAAVSITGIAGPTGGVPAHDGQEEKPVGLIYVGYYVNGKTDFEKFILHKGRNENRENAVTRALCGLRIRLLQEK